MASDSMPGMPLASGSNFSVAVQCDSGVELEKLFASMGEKGKVILPLQDTFWGSRFGMLVDRFGVNWMFNFEDGR
jgi:PhnB protein